MQASEVEGATSQIKSSQRLMAAGYSIAAIGLVVVVLEPSNHMMARWLVCGGNVIVAVAIAGRFRRLHVGHVAVAVLFNPIVPLFLHNRNRWLVIDFAVVFLIVSCLHVVRQKSTRQPSADVL